LLKAVIPESGHVPSNTHQLDELLDEIIQNDWMSITPNEIDTISRLSQYAVFARYSTSKEIGSGDLMIARKGLCATLHVVTQCLNLENLAISSDAIEKICPDHSDVDR